MRQSFKRDVGSLGRIFEFVRDFFAREGIDRDYLFSVDLAVEEIFTNMVKYHQANENEIVINLERDADRLLISLTDFDVEPFDITKTGEVPVDRPLDERRVGGLGIHLVKKVMDKIDYAYADRQSRITLTKRIKVGNV